MRREPALHEMNPTGRFSDRAADYVKYRPSYPSAAIDAVLEGRTVRVAADVGAGTGISSRAIAERGIKVIAVEPNAAMRAAAEPHPLVEWREGMAEVTGLEAESVDLVLCAQAFHWVRQEEALKEFARLLRRPGRIAIVWNERDKSDALMTGYRDAIREVGGEHPAEMRAFDPTVIDRSGLFAARRERVFPNEQRLDEEGLIGRAMSASYVPKEGALQEALIGKLRGLFARFKDAGGRVTLRYVTRVHLAECQTGTP